MASATTFKFTVRDTGIGLSWAEQEKLFHAFTQADSSTARRFGGTGLGLSISKKLVELLGGEIGVESASGQASTFWFTLTFEHSKNKVIAPHIHNKSSNQKTRHPNAQLWVADDNSVNQKILLAMLGKMGFRTHALSNSDEAPSLELELAWLFRHSGNRTHSQCPQGWPRDLLNGGLSLKKLHAF